MIESWEVITVFC